MILKIYSFFFCVMSCSIIIASQAPQNDWWSAAKELGIGANKYYIAPALQPKVKEGFEKVIGETEHEKLSKQKEQEEIRNLRQNIKSGRANELQVLGTTLQQHSQFSGDKKLKPHIDKFSNIIIKKLNEIYDEELPETKDSAKDSTANTDNETKENELDKNSKDIESNKGLFAKLGAILCPPAMVTGIDFMAKTCGAQALAQSIESAIPLFAGKQQAISRSIIVFGTAATCMALYKIYQAFNTEENEEEAADEFEFLKGYGAR